MSTSIAHAKHNFQVTQNQQQTQQPIAQGQRTLYQMAATKLVQNAPLLIKTTLALTALASLPTADADPCAASRDLCMRACMSWGGPDPRETGACILGCNLAYLVCRGMQLMAVCR